MSDAKERPTVADAAGESVARLHTAEVAPYWLSALIESADDAIISKTLDGVITSWNKGAERVFGYTADEVIGKPVTILIPEDHIDEEPRDPGADQGGRAHRALRDGARAQGRHARRHLAHGLAHPRAGRARHRRLEDRPRHHRAQAVGTGAGAARRHRRVGGRRHHQQDPRRRHHQLEQGRRARLRLHGGGGDRSARDHADPGGPHQRGAGDTGADQGGRAHRALRDGAGAQGRHAASTSRSRSRPSAGRTGASSAPRRSPATSPSARRSRRGCASSPRRCGWCTRSARSSPPNSTCTSSCRPSPTRRPS